PRWGHGFVAGELYALFRDHGFASVEPRAIIPPAGTIEATSPIPDFAFYRSAPPAAMEWMTRPPDLLVEILSPGQRLPDIRAKLDAYLAFGVGEVWVIDLQARCVDVFAGDTRRHLNDGDMLAPLSVPALHIDLADFFDRAGV
ncbi:MAG TPA: Uma2 family endonuclease, partial [Tepidiformaceae bacterium]|nr:Uma2 family endonuclease [Tepidiformaceae bacterium]